MTHVSVCLVACPEVWGHDGESRVCTVPVTWYMFIADTSTTAAFSHEWTRDRVFFVATWLILTHGGFCCALGA